MTTDEFGLIQTYFANQRGDQSGVVLGIGDDASILQLDAGLELLACTDTLVQGVHFFEDTDAYDLGYKSLAVNLSDMAAMGGQPLWCLLSLTLEHAEPAWLERFASGFFSAADICDVALVGGDTTRGPLTVSVHLLGSVESGGAIRRSGAGAGDLIYMSGNVGCAGVACAERAGRLPQGSAQEHCLERFQRPRPRVELGRALVGKATAAIDVSDGLAADLNHILKASGVGAVVHGDKLPCCTAVKNLSDSVTARNLAFGGGDDYELCFTVPVSRVNEVETLSKELDLPLTRIGEILEKTGIEVLESNGQSATLDPIGYQHF